MADDEGDNNPTTTAICTVIGGRSFIGKSLVSMLLKSNNWIVRISDTDPSLNLDQDEKYSVLSEAISSRKASYLQVDVRDKSQIIKAIEGSAVVFHMDATGSSSNDFHTQYLITVQGTKNVIRACRECKVKRLLYNSSADVVSDGRHDILNGDDSLSYPSRFGDMLGDLKAQAEAMVLFANNVDGVLTCALRPCYAFGPGDVKLVPILVNATKSGLAKFIVGNGENMCDFTYVDNIAHAHLCAEEALRSRTAFVAGKAFFITNHDPMKFWDFVYLLFEGLGYTRPRIKIPARLVWYASVLSEWVHEKLEQRKTHYILTPYIVHLFSSTITFNCSGAKNQIGYSPIVPLEEGVALTIESLSHVVEASLHLKYRDSNEPSKAYTLLGNGKVADLLLWRDEKKSFTYFLGLVLLYYWFFLSGSTFVSSAATLLLMILVFLFSHAILPRSLFGFNIKKISASEFDVSETVDNAVVSVASAWNYCMHTLRLIAEGDGDWNLFLKVIFSLYVFKWLVSLSFSAVTGVALVFAFTVFFAYMQYEDEADRLLELSFIGIKNLKGILIRKLPVTVALLLHNHNIIDQDVDPQSKGI